MSEIPPFPTRQMTILALCRICEPIAFMSILPYVYYMIKDFGTTTDDSKIAVYAGMVTSAFAFAEFSSGVAWGRLSDRIGRKPVLLTGLVGTALSMFAFGFAPNFLVALLARVLGGVLNGNIGVLQTTVAEMITVKEHQPRAYTIMPFVWCLGTIFGSTLGGELARPVLRFPNLFAKGTIWERFPYLLPNLVCTIIVSCGVVIGILFLEETHAEKKLQYDPGLAAGKWVLNKFTPCTNLMALRVENIAGPDEVSPLLGNEQPPTCASGESPSASSPSLNGESINEQPPRSTSAGSPNLPSVSPTSLNEESGNEQPPRCTSAELPDPSSAASPESQEARNPNAAPRSKPPATKVFTEQVVLNIVGYGILAYHTMTFDAMLPTLLSTMPPKKPELHLPFKFVSGYGLHPKEIGVIMSVQGIYSMFATIVIFPIIVRRLSALGLFRLVALFYPILYLSTPYFMLLPDSMRLVGVYVLVVWKCTFATLAYPSNAILLTNSAPSLLVLGTINGVAASVASLSRAFAPTVSGLLFSAGLGEGYSILPWWCSAVIVVVGSIISLSLTDKGGRMDVDNNEHSEQ